MIQVITPESKLYETSRQLWNRAVNLYPESIAYCSTEDDVREAILYARCNDKRVRIRTGGHNYAGFSSGDGVLIIDISNMNKIEINSTNNTVTIQGGALLGQIYNLLGSKGYPFPGGSCSTVGISGVVSGGGWGYSSRYLGLACDSLLGATLINDKGETVVANSERNTELFWAIRGGGGGNFGVITSLTFNLPDKVDYVTCFNISYKNPSIDTQVRFLDTWQHWIQNAPDAVNMKGSLLNSETDGINISCTGLFYGNPNQLRNILFAFSQIQGYQITYNYVSFLQSFQIITSVYPPCEHFIPYGRFVSCMYSRDVLLNLVNIINGRRPCGSSSVQLNVYGLGGKVKELAPDDTAFFYRNSSYILLLETIFKNNQVRADNIKWIQNNTPFIYNITSGSYINFPYPKLPNYLVDYYGANLEWLQMIKYKYDTDNFFCFPQSIR